jgi:hypothetical protein
MAELETALPPAKKTPVVDYYHQTVLVDSSNDFSSQEHDNKHRDAPGSENLNDLHNPNVYARALLLKPLPTDIDY